MSRERLPQSELELQLKRQNQQFQTVREALLALGDNVRLSIPDSVMEELDAAFEAPRLAVGRPPSSYPLVRG